MEAAGGVDFRLVQRAERGLLAEGAQRQGVDVDELKTRTKNSPSEALGAKAHLAFAAAMALPLVEIPPIRA